MEDKKAWTTAVGDLLKMDSRTHVEKIDYVKNDWNEHVTITFDYGDKSQINVSGNSLGSILHEIVREVYGDGALGFIGRWRD